MNPERLVAGLDIGSAKTTAIIAEVVGDLPEAPDASSARRRPGAHDRHAPRRRLRHRGDDALHPEGDAGRRAHGGRAGHEVYAGIAGEHVQAMTSKGIVAVSHDEIKKSDVDRANEVARAQADPAGPRAAARDPAGVHGRQEHGHPRSHRHERHAPRDGDVSRHDRQSPAINLRKSVERAGYKVRELVLEPLASALAVLTEDEKELGVALVEMGAGTTDLAVFHEGKIRHLGTIAFGGNNVTSDIVHGLGVTQADAERLKERYGCAYEPLVDLGRGDSAAEHRGAGRPRRFRASCWRTSSISAWTRSSTS